MSKSSLSEEQISTAIKALQDIRAKALLTLEIELRSIATTLSKATPVFFVEFDHPIPFRHMKYQTAEWFADNVDTQILGIRYKDNQPTIFHWRCNYPNGDIETLGQIEWASQFDTEALLELIYHIQTGLYALHGGAQDLQHWFKTKESKKKSTRINLKKRA